MTKMSLKFEFIYIAVCLSLLYVSVYLRNVLDDHMSLSTLSLSVDFKCSVAATFHQCAINAISTFKEMVYCLLGLVVYWRYFFI